MIRFRFVLVVLLCPLISCAAGPEEVEKNSAESVSTEAALESPPAINPEASIDEEVMFRVMAAEMRGNDGDVTGAVGDYLAAAMESDDPEVAKRATRVAFAAQAWQQASMAADRWALLDPENLSAHESAALAMLSTADYAGAELHLRTMLELSEDKDAAWGMVAGLLGRSASPEKASRVLQTLLESNGMEDNAAGTFAQSQLSARLGDFDLAYDYAARAVELAPERGTYLVWAGQLARNQGNNDMALEFTRRAWELNRADHDMTLAYADLLARTNQPDEARQLMAEMVQTPDVMLSRILFELSAEDPPAAMAIYDEFREMEYPSANELIFYRGQAADALGLSQDAIEQFEMIERGQYFLAATARRAELLAASGDVQGARQVLVMLRQQPDDTVIEQAWLTEAQILQQAGQQSEAVEVLNQALQQFPRSVALRYSRALIAAELGDIELAEADLLLVLGADSENAAALNALGYTLADQTDRLDEAEELIRRAYEILPDDAAITDSMGWVAFRQGRLDEAESYLRKAFELDPNPEIAAHLGEVLWVMDRKEEAQAVWDEAWQDNPGNPILQKTMDRLLP